MILYLMSFKIRDLYAAYYIIHLMYTIDKFISQHAHQLLACKTHRDEGILGHQPHILVRIALYQVPNYITKQEIWFEPNPVKGQIHLVVLDPGSNIIKGFNQRCCQSYLTYMVPNLFGHSLSSIAQNHTISNIYSSINCTLVRCSNIGVMTK